VLWQAKRDTAFKNDLANHTYKQATYRCSTEQTLSGCTENPFLKAAAMILAQPKASDRALW
jgi:hypothetical protein